MRKSQAIKLALLGTGAFAVSCCLCGGCGSGDDEYDPGPSQVEESSDNDPDWYDAQGNRIEEEYTLDEDGKLVPVGEPHDRFHRPLRFDDSGNRLPLGPILVAGAAGYAAGSAFSGGSSYRRSPGLWPFWSSRSSSYGRSYSPSRPSGTASGGSSYFGGSRPGTSSAPKSGGSSSSGSVSRGGFGSGGSSASS